MIPYHDVIGLMRLSAALLNPSLFEGWSTTVEEAKALKKYMILSDLRVHREQAGDSANYFDPYSVTSMAETVGLSWKKLVQLENSISAVESLESYEKKRAIFAKKFFSIAKNSIEDFRMRNV
jgi:glycosyltransferase involved in cell wall biosynthesis